MTNRPNTPHEDFIKEASRILEAAKERGIKLRLMGAIAFRIHCPNFGHIQDALGRVLSDIDFMAYSQQRKDIEKLFEGLGYQTDRMIKMLFGGKRLIFIDSTNHRQSDVFFDKLEMCHDIDFKGRLEIDYPTISLVDMLLEKMQIVKLNEKDIIDTIMLLREHEVGNSDKETVNAGYLAKLCANDWGLWRTVTMNLQKVKSFIPNYSLLTENDKTDVITKIDQLLMQIEREPKSMGWTMRAKIGDKKQWYRDVEEVVR
ncbi:hypothetical protein KEJ26_04160 [Candidatus Bathyarchaeota archaeon]|nr:hypothetical protein [Candidatus Bathyarchaeota archaeon]